MIRSFKHHSGRIYDRFMVTNEGSRWEPDAVYQCQHTGKVYARPQAVFESEFVPCDAQSLATSLAPIANYLHHTGRRYLLLAVANEQCAWEPVAVYRCTNTGKAYSRPWHEFQRKFRRE